MKNEQRISQSQWVRSLVDTHAADLTRYATSILRDPDLAKDVVQDVFLKLWKEPRATIEGHERAWLFKVCRNRSLDIYRKGGRMQPMNDAISEQTPVESPSPQVQAEQHDSHARIVQMMQSLPENQQEVVRLKFQNGMSYKEIAAVTELSVTNVGFLLHTAIQTLRTRVAAVGE
ncbi:MAG TPA: sigma-70 family RNA polymerase sigma factor [Opitutae bacterium]|nr:sigma-70 family RNA polymerase sigma factor [Opitutae bacterium]